MMDKFEIKNRKGEKIVVQLDGIDNKSGLVFVMHGLGGFKEQPHIKAIAEAFLDNNYVTVRFDTTNTFGESDGSYEKATITNYYEDLEDVIKWTSGQNWYQEPFCLAGHSLGGICITLYAQNYPDKVKSLIPVSSVISGKLSEQIMNSKELEEWEQTGWHERMSFDGKRLKRLPWSHMTDRLKYDLLPGASRLTMPVLLIVGEKDDTTPSKYQQLLFNKLPGGKKLHIIKGAGHNFRSEEQIIEVKNTIKDWVKGNLK